jgi:hypothetical protein
MIAALASAVIATAGATAWGDDVTMKNGLVFKGTVDKDDTLRMISDGLKRVVVRDSKIARIDHRDSFRRFDAFLLDQPIQVHGGLMPTAAFGIEATPWDAKGRRQFRYTNQANKVVRMQQAIISIGPRTTGYRGVDGFWQGGNVATTQVPKEVILGLLAKADRKDLTQRLRIASFLTTARWYPEAKAEVESIAKDFPDERSKLEDRVHAIQDAASRDELLEIATIRGSRKPRELLARLRAFPSDGAAPDVLADARDQLRKEEEALGTDRRIGESLRTLQKGFSEAVDTVWKPRIPELLRCLEDAPDAARPRLDAFAKADPSASVEDRLALAMSGWIVGSDRATASLPDALALWKYRDELLVFFRAEDEDARAKAIERIEEIKFEDEKKIVKKQEAPRRKAAAPAVAELDPKEVSEAAIRLDRLTRIIQLMPPPLHDPARKADTNPITHRVAGDLNPEPTDYMVLLPPEYHPLRSYPAILSMHDGYGPKHAIDWWAKEAARRGYIVIAPQYNPPGLPPSYRYTQPEHAAVELALRDARKRYAIDSDRVALHGVLPGGDGALDVGLSHPDLFSCVAVVSGEPGKFVFSYRQHVEHVPLYMAIGDLAPGNREVVFDGFAKPLITKAEDVTYVEYHNRGLEDLPEEAPVIMDWIDAHRRDPYPKQFEAATARGSDARFWGVVVQEHTNGQTIAPEAADPNGANIQPARISDRTLTTTNSLRIKVAGVKRLDVWVSPKVLDFKKRMDVRINDASFLHGLVKPDLAQMLNDLRHRFDRQQIYWKKVSAGRSG